MKGNETEMKTKYKRIRKEQSKSSQEPASVNYVNYNQCIIINCCRVIPVIPSNNCPAGREGDYYSLPQTCPILPGSRARRNRITSALPWQGWMADSLARKWWKELKVVEAYEIEMKGLSIQAGRIQVALAASQFFNRISCCVILHNHEYLYSKQFHSAFDLNLSCVLAPKSCQAGNYGSPSNLRSTLVDNEKPAVRMDAIGRGKSIWFRAMFLYYIYICMSMCSIQLISYSIIVCTSLPDIL